MSLPLSVGDLVTAGQLAYKLYTACRDAGDDYRDLEQLCHTVHLVINRCNSTRVLLRQDAATIDLFASDMKSTLGMVDHLLIEYKGMDGTSLINYGRRIKFSLATSSDRASIERKLEGQLRTLNSFLAGTTLDYQTLTVRLLSSLVQEMQAAAQGTPVDPKKLKALIEELGCENQETRDKLLANEEEIRKKVNKETIKTATQDEADTPKSLASILEESTELIKSTQTPAPTKTDKFDYNSPWFSWMQANTYFLSVNEAFTNHPFLPEPVIRYSEVDEWLCPFLEGWTLNRTAAQRLGETEDAYYFSFNGLSAQYQDLPKTSRLYFRRSSLIPDIPPELKNVRIMRNPDKSLTYDGLNSGWVNLSPVQEKLSRFVWNYANFIGCVAPFCTPWPAIRAHYSVLWPFDLSDEVTRLFVWSHYGNSSNQGYGFFQYTVEQIDASLPPNWMWKRDNTGRDHHTYIDLGTNPPTESTVHPSRFYDRDRPEDVYLPAGWDRRLDYDGNVFYVDHNTRTATRVNPQENRNVDQQTGLPKGWRKITDNKSKAWYYTKINNNVVATIYPSTLNSRSLDRKIFLTKPPQEGQSVSALFDKDQDNNYYYNSDFRDLDPPPMTGPEKQRYYDIFRQAGRKNKFKITWTEAVTHCQILNLPPSLYMPILTEADANEDKIFTPAEYAAALHKIRFALKDIHKNQVIQPPTDEDMQRYDAAFQRHTSDDALEIPLQDAIKLSMEAGFGLAEEVIGEIWEEYDTNRDGMLDIVEFCEAYHRLMTEMQRRQGTCDVLSKFEMSSNLVPS